MVLRAVSWECNGCLPTRIDAKIVSQQRVLYTVISAPEFSRIFRNKNRDRDAGVGRATVIPASPIIHKLHGKELLLLP